MHSQGECPFSFPPGCHRHRFTTAFNVPSQNIIWSFVRRWKNDGNRPSIPLVNLIFEDTGAPEDSHSKLASQAFFMTKTVDVKANGNADDEDDEDDEDQHQLGTHPSLSPHIF